MWNVRAIHVMPSMYFNNVRDISNIYLGVRMCVKCDAIKDRIAVSKGQSQRGKGQSYVIRNG